MTVQISLPADMEARLEQRARAAGKDVPTWVREALEEKLAVEPSQVPETGADQWETELNAWIKSHKTTSPFVDDSRESIYGDRGQ